MGEYFFEAFEGLTRLDPGSKCSLCGMKIYGAFSALLVLSGLGLAL